MPPDGEQSLRFDPVDSNLERHALVLLLSLRNIRVNRSPYDCSAYACPGRERAVELHAEPGAEFCRVRQRAPDSLPRRAQKDLFLDAVCAHTQPPGCRLAWVNDELQPLGCGMRSAIRPAAARVLTQYPRRIA